MITVRHLLLSKCGDEDKDTLCDSAELLYFGDLSKTAEGDEDLDGLTNGEEINEFKSDPTLTDTDGDSFGDYIESLLGMKLYVPFSAAGGTLGGDSAADLNMLHKLNRLSFGPTQELINQVAALGGIDNWIADQLAAIDLPPAPPRDSSSVAPIYNSDDDVYPNPYDCSSHTTPDPAQALRDCYVSNDDDDDINVMGTIRPMHSTRQLQSRMAMFWDNHFNTDINSHFEGMMELYDEDYYFVNAFGNFNELLEYNAKKYTMLRYLDLEDNIRSAPNENFPREIMELHSISINGGYTATDIAQLALILTGWDQDDVEDLDLCAEPALISEDPDVYEPFNLVAHCTEQYISRYSYYREANNDGTEGTVGSGEGEVTGREESARFDMLRLFTFYENRHDDGLGDYDGDGITNLSKTLFAGTEHETSIISQSGEAGVTEGEDAIAYLAAHPASANFICTKLAQEFVSDVPDLSTLSSCESVFLANTLSSNQIGLVLQDLFGSAEFNDPLTRRSKLKDNQEAMISLARILGWDATHSHPDVSFSSSLAEEIEDTEQPLFEKAEPTGYYETADNWLNTNVLLNRFEEMNDMVLERSRNIVFSPPAEPDEAKNEQRTQDFVAYFNSNGMTTSGEIMKYLFQVMLGGYYDIHDVQLAIDLLHPEESLFDLNDPTDSIEEDLTSQSNNIPDSVDRIRALIARLAAMPEFQLH